MTKLRLNCSENHTNLLSKHHYHIIGCFLTVNYFQNYFWKDKKNGCWKNPNTHSHRKNNMILPEDDQSDGGMLECYQI